MVEVSRYQPDTVPGRSPSAVADSHPASHATSKYRRPQRLRWGSWLCAGLVVALAILAGWRCTHGAPSSHTHVSPAPGDSAHSSTAQELHTRAHQSTGSTATAQGAPTGSSRLIAVADVHGDLNNTLACLRLVRLVDEHGMWTGGTGVLVQTGDIMDRGPHSLELLRLFEQLKVQAAEAGGQVHTLLGNHEIMNLLGQYQYVSREELARLGLEASHGLEQGAALKKEPPEQAGLRHWHALMQQGAEVGDLLRSRATAVVLGTGACRTLFVHAGLLPELLDSVSGGDALGCQELVERLNDRMQRAVAQCASEGGCHHKADPDADVLYGSHSPVWYRGYAQHRERQECAKVRQVLQWVGAQRVVVGHTVMPGGRFRSRCGGRLTLIDIGISRAYVGAHGAWECQKDVAQVQYPETVVALEVSDAALQ